MATEVQTKLEALRARTMREAQEVLTEQLPTRAVALGALHKELVSRRASGDHRVARATVESWRTNLYEEIPVNAAVMDAANRVRGEIEHVLAQTDSLKTWVELSMPRMEDGNNFGVEVQMEVLEMINALYKSGRQTLANLTIYNRSRGKLLTNMRKRLHLEDYAASIATIDDVYFSMLIQHCFDLFNSILVLRDTMMKNIEKLRKPKGEMNSIFVQ
ncbi:Proteasome activator complex subunit 1 [Hondaea fermentalgiana]|uniref:Proteasome activator complex subunit 1 n=1 Tax=Hondaea fermentalgiana TaxID=2315210 RepID=A0A2R5GEG4_9STRA|nr:Proteasome activator complex subunit 1 [Hondaea fermentalgiana]|eukprot:GBG28128.1 Proteasome activator complex subunit 1 [Hondaea fermentalgiana]